MTPIGARRSRTCRAITLASSPHRGNCAHSVWRTCCFHPATHHHRNSVISRLGVFLRRDRGAVRVLPIVSNASISPAPFLAVLSVIAGIAVLVRPLSGLISLAVVLIVGFALIGAEKLIYPLERTWYFSNYQGWIRATGVVDLVLAAWMFADLPATALWAPNMILGRIARIVLASLERGSLP
jgi:hypothetical protein